MAIAKRRGATCVLLCCVWFGCAAPARAQHAVAAPPGDAPAAATLAADRAPAAPPRPARPKSLVPLYVSFASLQALDVHSTARALERGGSEANPLLKGVAGNPLALAAVKVAGSAAVVYASEKMRKKNKKAAVVFMLATNAVLAVVVQHNYRAAK